MISLVKTIPSRGWVNRWPHVNFSQFKHLEEVAVVTMDVLNRMVEDASRIRGWMFTIFSDYREGDKGQHGKHLAIDGFFYHRKPGDVPVLEQYLFALRYDWRGVGLYPSNNTPSIHIDMRQEPKYAIRRALWWRDGQGEYHPGDEFGEALTARTLMV